MASITSRKNGTREIQFVAKDGKRQTLRLGKVGLTAAKGVQRIVESLDAAKRLGTVPDNTILEGVSSLDAKLRKRLFQFGLIGKPEEKSAEDMEAAKVRLGEFLDAYMARRTNVKSSTREIWSQPKRNLLEFFGSDRDIASITEGDAEDFKIHLAGEHLAGTTVHKRLQFARQFFQNAMKRKLIPSNPFQEVRSKAGAMKEWRFVEKEEIYRVLAACPNVDWRIIVALSRFGGLRCPSEVLSLRWADVDWEGGGSRSIRQKRSTI